MLVDCSSCSIKKMHVAILIIVAEEIFFNTFFKLILNLTLFNFFSPKLTLLTAPIAMARRNACAAPCMVARREG